MKHEQIVDGEAMSAVEGIDATHLIGTHMVVDLQQEPQRAAFNTYRVAFRDNAHDPNLAHAAALVAAWNSFADIMGIDRV